MIVAKRKAFDELKEMIKPYKKVLTVGCGTCVSVCLAGGEKEVAVLNAELDMARKMDDNPDVGFYEERCRSCGACVLGMTGGICPVTMCAKGLYNGPCGGTNKGKCEISQDQPCAWFMIYDRLSQQGRLDLLHGYKEPVEWLDQVPRMTIQPGYKKPEEE